MRICRYDRNGRPGVGFFDEDFIVSLDAAANAYAELTGGHLDIPADDGLLQFLPPEGRAHTDAVRLADWVATSKASLPDTAKVSTGDVQLLVPIPRPNKLFLLAGNYAAHVEEGGEAAAERAETFPYVFMKPPTTTLTNPGSPVRIPTVSPGAIDYELELAVIIGRTARSVKAADALDYVAGYTVINDVSNRKFRPNPGRKPREKDKFFDWLHGKWHDGFCPCGPCIVSGDAVPNPQNLKLQLRVNGELRQDASTSMQVFPVADVIEFIASFVTLEPGDVISTGTPSGVGFPRETFLQPGDRIEASISSIGTLVTPMIAE